MSPSPPIVACPLELQRQALELLCDFIPAPFRANRIEEILTEAAAGRSSLAGLQVMRIDERVVGAVWCALDPGRVAALLSPAVSPGMPEVWQSELATAGIAWGKTHGASMALALQNRGETPTWLAASGLKWLADLEYLALPLPSARHDLTGELVFEVISPQEAVRLGALLERTYRDTLDCPGLEGLRQTQDTISGYLKSGVHVPEWWLVARHFDQDVGCILLADLPREERVELLYMGLVPEARGRGWGNELIRKAIALASTAGRRQLVLAVDARNEPAVRAYMGEGFRAWQARTAFVAKLAE